jgi:hypothetical protein
VTVSAEHDKKFDAFVSTLKALGAKAAYVGVLASGKANESHGNGEDAITNVQVATWNEFGTDDIDERSFLRDTLTIKKAEIEASMAKRVGLALTGKISPDEVHERTGLQVVGMCQQRISDGIPPGNAPSTLAQKDSAPPLIDTGQLRGAITHEVR